MKFAFIPAAIVTLAATAAFAAAPTFAEVDTNADGWVTPDEFAVAMPEATDTDFVAIDVNGDGAISEEEMSAHLAAQPATNG